MYYCITVLSTTTDINECVTGSHQCEQNCFDVDGSYNCLCEVGYTLEPDRITCKKGKLVEFVHDKLF